MGVKRRRNNKPPNRNHRPVIKKKQYTEIKLYAKQLLLKKRECISKLEKKRKEEKAAEKADKDKSKKVIRRRMPKYYPTESPRRKLKTSQKSFSQHKRKLRSSLTPGTVVIMVAGPHRGKRAVFLKQLDTGLLLVTGPFKYNRVPLRRINQIYVIATKTKIDISGVEIPERVNDKYFKRKKIVKPKKGDGNIFETEKEKYTLSPERIEDQKVVDNQLIPKIKEVRFMKNYLRARFGLGRGQFPHSMVF